MSCIAGIVGAFGKSDAGPIIERMMASMAYRDEHAAGKAVGEINRFFPDAAGPNCFFASSTSIFVDTTNRTVVALCGGHVFSDSRLS